MKPRHRSVSQWSTFAKCGEQYRLERRSDAPERPAAWFVQGTAFHKAAEEWEGSLRSLTTAEAVSIFEDTYDAELDELLAKEPELTRWMTGGRVKARDDMDRRRTRGAAQVLDYIAYARQAPERPWPYMGDEVAVEVEFLLDLDGIQVKGFIDQVLIYPDGNLTVRDLKTGNKPDWSFQLGVYRLAIEQDYGILPNWGDYYLAKEGKPCPPIPLTSFTRERVTRWFKDMDRAEKLGLYLPNPGDHCRTCGVVDFCSAVGVRADEHPPKELEDSLWA